MKKLITPLILMLLYVTNAMSCHSEHPHCVTVDGIHYAYEIRGKEVCDVFVYGFETAQDSIVLPTEVTIMGGKRKVTSVYIPDEYPSFLKIKTSSPKILVIPDGYKDISMLTLPELEKIYISKSVTSVHDICTSEYAAISCEKLKEIIVDPENKNYCSIGGILYTKDKEALLKYPPMRNGGIFTIPTHVKTIHINAFHSCNLKKIFYPKSRKLQSYDQFDAEDIKELREHIGVAKKVVFLPK